MQQLEMRQKLVTYCDHCRDEVQGNFTVLRSSDGQEHHACHKWNEPEQARCDELLARKFVAEVRARREAECSSSA